MNENLPDVNVMCLFVAIVDTEKLENLIKSITDILYKDYQNEFVSCVLVGASMTPDLYAHSLNALIAYELLIKASDEKIIDKLNNYYGKDKSLSDFDVI